MFIKIESSFKEDGTIFFEEFPAFESQIAVSPETAEEIFSGNLCTFQDVEGLEELYSKYKKEISSKNKLSAYTGNPESTFNIDDIIRSGGKISAEEMEKTNQQYTLKKILKKDLLEEKGISVLEFIKRLGNLNLPIQLHNAIINKLFGIKNNKHFKLVKENKTEDSDNILSSDPNFVATGKDGSKEIATVVLKHPNSIEITIMYQKYTGGLDQGSYDNYPLKSVVFKIGHVPKMGEYHYEVEGKLDGKNFYQKGNNLHNLVAETKSVLDRKIRVTGIPAVKNVH